MVGTLAYMSPEQLDGHADERSDIFSFGAVLFEMLTGRKAFDGTTSSAVIGAIVHTDPPAVSSLRPDVSPLSIAWRGAASRRTLTPGGSPRRIWSTSSGGLPAIRWPGGTRSVLRCVRDSGYCGIRLTAAAATSPSSACGSGCAWPTASVFRTAAAVQFVVSVPDGYELAASTKAALSPDGRMVVFAASDAKSVTGLWLRTLDEERPRVLPGTEDAAYAFWSPDSTRVAFFANKQLKRVAIAGGPSFTVCEAGVAAAAPGTQQATSSSPHLRRLRC